MARVLEDILHMNSGDQESSYANNSFLQETAIRKALHVLKHAIKDVLNDQDAVLGQCFNIADLGCSSGKNTLLVVHNIINIVYETCNENNRRAPQFQVYLNDLFRNDFNSMFKLLPDFYAKLKKAKGETFGPCFVSATPGSFYGRLFQDQSLHLVHSSYSVHWLSKVPEGLENNELNIYISKTSPPNVFKAYMDQFHTDFTKFLRMRSEEIVRGGRMVLIILGRSTSDPTSDDCYSLWDLFAQSLFDMFNEGLVQESDIKTFTLPFYTPCEEEIRKAIQFEGSFCLDMLTVFEVNWDPRDTDYTNMNDLNSTPNYYNGKNAANVIRAVMEPLLTCHFGSSIIDLLFKKFGERIAEYLAYKKTRHFNIVISLTKT